VQNRPAMVKDFTEPSAYPPTWSAPRVNAFTVQLPYGRHPQAAEAPSITPRGAAAFLAEVEGWERPTPLWSEQRTPPRVPAC
jgi:hypothetical protein